MTQRKKKESNQLTDRTLSGLFWVFSGTGAQGILQFIVLIVLARLIKPQDFGIVNAAMIIIGFSMIFAQLGVGPAIVQRSELEEKHLRTGFTLSLFFGLFLALFIGIFASVISRFFHSIELTSVLRVLVFVFPLQGVALVPESLLMRELKFRLLAIVQALSYLFGYGLVGIACAILGLGVWSLVFAHLSQNIIKVILLIMLQPYPKKWQLELKALKDLLYFGGGFTIAKIGNYLALQGDNFIVGRFLGTEALGLYGRAYQLMVMPATLFGQVLDQVLFPAMSKVQHDKERLTKIYRRGISAVAILIFPLMVFIIVFAEHIVYVLLGEQWGSIILPFQVLAIGMIFRTSYKIGDSLARATGVVYRRAWRQWVYAVAVLIGAYLGHFGGLIGVALGIVGALSINYYLMASLSLDVIEMSWLQFFRAQFSGLLLGCIVLVEVISIDILFGSYLTSFWILVTSALLVGGSLMICITLFSRLLLGEDGQWVYVRLKEFVLKMIKTIYQKKEENIDRGIGKWNNHKKK